LFRFKMNKRKKSIYFFVLSFFLLTVFVGPGKTAGSAEAEIERLKQRLENKREELSLEREAYLEARRDWKEAARTGFLGFGRTKEETQILIEAREVLTQIQKSYTGIRRRISSLERELRKAEREKALEERRRQKEGNPSGAGNPSPSQPEQLANPANPGTASSLEKAIEYFDAALRHKSLGQNQQAEENLEKALQFEPGLGEHFFSKGVENFNRKNRWEAKRYFERAKILFQSSQDWRKLKLVDEYLEKIFLRR